MGDKKQQWTEEDQRKAAEKGQGAEIGPTHGGEGSSDQEKKSSGLAGSKPGQGAGSPGGAGSGTPSGGRGSSGGAMETRHQSDPTAPDSPIAPESNRSE